MIAKEYKVVALRECPLPEDMQICDTPELAAKYWRTHIINTSCYDPERECLAVVLLNTRRRIKGHQLVSTGTNDQILVHPREVFRLAVTASAHAILIAHNLCAAAHKLCYVQRRFMCSRPSEALAPTRVPSRKERCATN